MKVNKLVGLCIEHARQFLQLQWPSPTRVRLNYDRARSKSQKRKITVGSFFQHKVMRVPYICPDHRRVATNGKNGLGLAST